MEFSSDFDLMQALKDFDSNATDLLEKQQGLICPSISLQENSLNSDLPPLNLSEEVCEFTSAKSSRDNQPSATEKELVSDQLHGSNYYKFYALNTTSDERPQHSIAAVHSKLEVAVSTDAVNTPVLNTPSETTSITKRRCESALVDAGDVTITAVNHIDRSEGNDSPTPPVKRGTRGQLAYDTQQVDARTARRLLVNRASAARSQRRRAARVREAEAAVVRSELENAALRAQLAAAVRFIEQLGHVLPSSQSTALALPSSPSRQR